MKTKRKHQLKALKFESQYNGDWKKGEFIIKSSTIRNAGKDQWKRLIGAFR